MEKKDRSAAVGSTRKRLFLTTTGTTAFRGSMNRYMFWPDLRCVRLAVLVFLRQPEETERMNRALAGDEEGFGLLLLPFLVSSLSFRWSRFAATSVPPRTRNRQQR